MDLLWPPRTTCLLCEARLNCPGGPAAERVPVCAPCWDSMGFTPGENRCTNCERPLAGGGGLCAACESPPPFGKVWALGLHRGALREAIHHLKFNSRGELGTQLGRRLARQIPARYELVVPVPLHVSRLRERGYNQAALIGGGLAEVLGLTVVEGVLVRLRPTGHQAKLDRQARLNNLRQAFSLRRQVAPPWAGRRILLVDDVLTTGATASAAAQVLRRTGARQVDLAVLAVSDMPVDALAHQHG